MEENLDENDVKERMRKTFLSRCRMGEIKEKIFTNPNVRILR
jgi:hypothetical protein